MSLVAFVGACICFPVVPTRGTLLEREGLASRPFSGTEWREARSYEALNRRIAMLDDLEARLNRERPSREVAIELLGPDEYGQAFWPGAIAYHVAHPIECGADLYWLVVYFNARGEFVKATTSCD